jgi:hypothetical protein
VTTEKTKKDFDETLPLCEFLAKPTFLKWPETGHYGRRTSAEQGCQTFLGTTYQNLEKISPKRPQKYTKLPKKIRNGSKKDQMAIKFTNIFHCKTLQNFTQIGILWFENIHTIWQPCCRTNCLVSIQNEVGSKKGGKNVNFQNGLETLSSDCKQTLGLFPVFNSPAR